MNSSSLYNEQWPQETIERLLPNLSDRVRLMIMVVHAMDYLRDSANGNYSSCCNAIEILNDGLKNIFDRDATGLEWWTLRHRLSHAEIQSGSWLDECKTSWISAREAEEKRNHKQR